MKYAVAIILALTVLTGCKLSVPQINEACDVLRAAGINQNFRLSKEEVQVITREHKIILNNIKQWFKKNCA